MSNKFVCDKCGATMIGLDKCICGRLLAPLWHNKEGKPCRLCETPSEYSDQWDARFCPKCNKWLENMCLEAECYFECSKRPDKPL